MVNPIGVKPAPSAPRLQPVAAVSRAPAAEAATGEDARTVSTSGLRSLAADAAKAPPVDHDRVSALRTAIAENRFSIQPETIADRMLAQKTDWSSDDAA